jgi:hypothetical protein
MGALDLEKRRAAGAAEGPQEARFVLHGKRNVRLSFERINHAWSYNCMLDQTESHGRLKWPPVLDEFIRECWSL